MCALNILDSTHITPYAGDPIINDFAFTVATKNGSGSQTSNNVLVMSLFKMGIPVNGKNLFPSNIKGLPTWYTIRASKHGYTARRAVTEIAVVMNQDTAAEDIANLPVGGVCIIPQEWKWGQSRTDIIYYEIPVDAIVKNSEIDKAFKDRVGNMVYVGVVAKMFSIPLDIAYAALLDNFNGKEKPAKMNFTVVQNAHQWAEDNLVKRDPYQFAPMNATAGKIVITGNEAAGLGAIFGGLTVAAWYPITPSTSVIDSVLNFKHLRVDPETGKDTVAVVQAEDEIAAIGMIIGAGWAGARAMTATSGPGISLMAEVTGLAYFAEIPCVIWDITRMGPSTGLPTRTSQGDLIFTHFLGHGDSRQIVMLPGSVEECFEFGWSAFDYADTLQTPVFVLSDLDLGMNNWMAQPFDYPAEPLKRGKVLNADQLEAFIKEKGNWGRYMDYDKDGIPYRTLPGTDHARSAWFARGTGHNEMAAYTERGDDWVKNMTRLRVKFETARNTLPAPVTDTVDGAKVGILSFGSNHDAIREARDYLAAENIATDYMRVRALPLAHAVHDFVRAYDHVFVVENNFDGQLHQLLSMDFHDSMAHVTSLASGDSLPMTPNYVFDHIMTHLRK
ncbi:MAG: 2-oxoacid:acceptor oxidoreductase subunit alpha [Armatimonadetes bacterium]|nr:2-oxoacid:acceptor oxidoreductase subunit alpha [Anaerolineae bacterium]